MRNKLVLLLMFGILCILNVQALAAVIIMSADDGAGTTSFNAGTHWTGGAAPVAGNAYYTSGHLLRLSATSGTYTFAGDSLTLGYDPANDALANSFPFPGGAVNNDGLLFKATNEIANISNLIMDAGIIRDGNGTGQSVTLNGNLYVTSRGGGFYAQCNQTINSVISGPGTIYFGDNGSGEAGRTVTFTSGLSTYAGNIIMSPLPSRTTAGYARLTFAAGSIMNFTIGANGVNNSISGIGTLDYAGALNINLTAADNTIGDTWILSNPMTQTYESTFSINGFTSLGDSNTWTEAANGVIYQYTQNNGTLTVVPEPATAVMALIGALGMGLIWLRKRG
jgi:hypothetical protein